MSHIDPDTLMTLEAYAKARKDFRARVLAHKKDRTVALGDVRIFDQHRRLPIAAVGNQRIVGGELVADALFLEYTLDAQHLLNLITDRELVLEY